MCAVISCSGWIDCSCTLTILKFCATDSWWKDLSLSLEAQCVPHSSSGSREPPPPATKIVIDFMQFFGKFNKIVSPGTPWGLAPPGKILDPPLPQSNTPKFSNTQKPHPQMGHTLQPPRVYTVMWSIGGY